MFFIGKEPYKIDFLTRVQNVTWDEVINNARYFPFENLKILIIGFYEPILMKMATGRLKDKADVEELKKIRKFRKKM